MSVRAPDFVAAGPEPAWTIADSAELYRTASWGAQFFFVNEQGHVAVNAMNEAATTMDIVAIVDELRRRGVQFPVLLRFQDVLRARVRRLNEAFRNAIGDSGYGNDYRGVYPIKVNQLHEVVDELLDAGKPWGMGLGVRIEDRAHRGFAAARRRNAARLQRGQGQVDAVAHDRRATAWQERDTRDRELLGIRRSQEPCVQRRFRTAAGCSRAACDTGFRPLGRSRRVRTRNSA